MGEARYRDYIITTIMTKIVCLDNKNGVYRSLYVIISFPWVICGEERWKKGQEKENMTPSLQTT